MGEGQEDGIAMIFSLSHLFCIIKSQMVAGGGGGGGAMGAHGVNGAGSPPPIDTPLVIIQPKPQKYI